MRRDTTYDHKVRRHLVHLAMIAARNGNLINWGRDSEGLDFIRLRNVEYVGKYNWGGSWFVEFTDESRIEFPRKWHIDDFSFDAPTGELLIGFD